MPSLGISILLIQGPLPSLYQSKSVYLCVLTTGLLYIVPRLRKAWTSMHMPQKAGVCSNNAPACSRSKARYSHAMEGSGFWRREV